MQNVNQLNIQTVRFKLSWSRQCAIIQSASFISSRAAGARQDNKRQSVGIIVKYKNVQSVCPSDYRAVR